MTGGVGIGGDLNIGGTLSAGALSLPSTLNVATINNNIGGSLTLASDNDNVFVAGSLGVSGGYALTTDEVAATTTLTLNPGASTFTNKPIQINNSTAAVSTSTGALTVSGGAGIGGNVHVGGTLVVNSAGGITTTSGAINLVPASNVVTTKPFISSNTIATSNTTVSTSTTTGAVTVSGGVGIAGAINAGGTLTTSSRLTVGTSTAQAQGARFVLGGTYASPDTTGWAYTAANRFLISSATGDNARGVSIGINDTSNIAYMDVTSPNVAWCGLTINCGTYTLNNVSEDRLKEDVALVDHVDVSRKFKKMKFKSYNLKSEAKERCEGYMASELQETFPELVSVNADGNRMVNYWGLMLKLFPLYQDLAERVEQLESALNMQGGVEAQSIQEIPTRKRKRKSAPSE